MSTNVPAYAHEWIAAHPKARPAAVAAALGCAHATAKAWRSRMIRAGDIAPLYKAVDMRAVQEQIDNGLLLAEAAQRLGVHVDSVQGRMSAQGMRVEDLRDGRVYRSTDIARLFGCHPGYGDRLMHRLCAAGLVARHAGKRRSWLITADALIAFLDHPNAARWRARVVDPEWRAYIDEALAAPSDPIRNDEIRRWFGGKKEAA